SKQRRRVVDSVAPGVGTVHGQQRVEANLSGYDEAVKGRVPHEACDRRAGPLREGKDLLVGRLRAAQTLASDDDGRVVGVLVYAELMAGCADVAHVDGRCFGYLSRDPEVPVVTVRSARVGI